MSSGYRGILRYDQVIRILPESSTTEGVLLPPFPGGSFQENLRLAKPAVDWIWVDLWHVTFIWVEYHNGSFTLHVINIPEVNTQALEMSPDDIFRLAISDGVIYLKSTPQLKEEAFVSKLSALKALANSYVDKARSIFGGFMGASAIQADYLLEVGTAYNTHLTTLSNFATYEEIQRYNITSGWPV